MTSRCLSVVGKNGKNGGNTGRKERDEIVGSRWIEQIGLCVIVQSGFSEVGRLFICQREGNRLSFNYLKSEEDSMSQAIDIMTELEKVFDKEKAKVLTNAILKREEEGNLVTKDYLHMVINGLKADFFKEMGSLKDDLRTEMSTLKDDLRTEMSTLKDDLRTEMNTLKDDLQTEMSRGFLDVYKAINGVQKSITRMTIYFISAIGTIAIILKVLDIIFANNP
ncbi:MAG: hypothetical protein IEMM0008_0502 [bacterium]|nr:MAG: hypothetical protein IEMM0008_0502 [bacterium]